MPSEHLDPVTKLLKCVMDLYFYHVCEYVNTGNDATIAKFRESNFVRRGAMSPCTTELDLREDWQ